MRFMLPLAILLCLVPSMLMAQKGDASPLEPGQYFERAGGFISAGGVRQSGSFSVDCPCQSFIGGGGSEFALGALYEHVKIGGVIWGVNAGYQYRSLDAKYLLDEDTTLRSTSSSSLFANVRIPFRHSSTVNLGTVTVTPYVKYFLAGSLFGRLGASLQVVVNSSKDFRKTLLVNSVTLPNDDVVAISLDRNALEQQGKRMISDNEVVLEEGAMKDLSAFQLSLHPAVGFQWKVGKRMFLLPMIEYALPLTGLSSVDTTFSMQAWRAVVEIHLDF